MQQPVPTGGSALPVDPIDAMQALAAMGFHVFPAAHGAKTPYPGLKSWLPFGERPAEAAFLEQFRGLAAPPNIGLICDEHLVVIDIDNLQFGAYFEAQGPERLGTWVVQTPSGGLHVYVRSVEPIATTVLKTPGGLKVGDLKARGGYVICPPSVGAHGDYETAYGDPSRILEVDNAREWFLRAYVDRYSGTLPVRIDSMSVGDEYTDVRAQDAPAPDVQQALGAELRGALLARKLRSYVYVTLTQGSDADGAQEHWKDPDDHSEIDFGCICDLYRLGWTLGKIEQWYAFAPVGEHRYRGRDKSRGHGYLQRTFDRARAKVDDEAAQLSNLQLGNAVVRPGTVERYYDASETYYRIDFQSTTFPHRKPDHVELRGVDFVTPHAFRVACMRWNFQPDLGNFDSASKLGVFFDGIKELAADVPLPEGASAEGQIRAQIRKYVETMAHPLLPGAERRILHAWTEGAYVFLRWQSMMPCMRNLHPTPSPRTVFEQWEALGGTSLNGEMWRAPKHAFAGLVEP
jgi:hypothetical protein